ncbi:MAG: hypothetical protein GY854_35370, partial [Deltaproteobacteria bacterium]|nr:hypothetical protein [Deltaproteobacteria bacterium]
MKKRNTKEGSGEAGRMRANKIKVALLVTPDALDARRKELCRLSSHDGTNREYEEGESYDLTSG